MLTLEQLKLFDVLLQPVGRVVSPEVTDNVLAGLPSSVANAIVSEVLLPLATVTGLALGVPITLSLVVALYGTLIVPLFDSPASLRYV